ncbi:MAG: TrmB family transcriptional regulator [Candidatus Diapherotrites archaeon]|uniref:TrmB family transcriptional regulator n=1 Tax=Candidatus Iainarchaeum sp. TaxID=3101447 RepID=A0A8T4KTQ4_9ARCH|nr:TrmB family transcriptional regulator [Candidatus Diapherotrites archaeon]
MDLEAVNGFLQRLGLTEYEARTLSSLFRLREAEAPEISRSAQVPKTRVYDVLERLMKRKLVIETYGRPKKYRVLESEAVFKELLNGKKNEISDLEREAGAIRSVISDSGAIAKSEGERVMKVKDRNDFIKILSQELGSAKSDVIAFTNFSKHHYPEFADAIKKASSKKVKVRVLAKLPNEVAHLSKEFAKSGVSHRDAEHGMHAYVVDGKKVILAISDFTEEKPEYHFTIWPNNKGMASALSGYFEEVWKKGK